jgi:cation diffusion facilitator family transporter
LHPAPIDSVPFGIALSILATCINALVGTVLLRAGRRLRSTALSADGHHLMTDVWTSVAVVVGVLLVRLTGATWIDPLAASMVAIWVLWTGFRILQKAASGLVDVQLDPVDQRALEGALAPFRLRGIGFSAIRTRKSGSHAFVQLAVRVPGSWTVEASHTLADEVETAVLEKLRSVSIDTHIEPLRS